MLLMRSTNFATRGETTRVALTGNDRRSGNHLSNTVILLSTEKLYQIILS
jgi:hypothetical protein